MCISRVPPRRTVRLRSLDGLTQARGRSDGPGSYKVTVHELSCERIARDDETVQADLRFGGDGGSVRARQAMRLG